MERDPLRKGLLNQRMRKKKKIDTALVYALRKRVDYQWFRIKMPFLILSSRLRSGVIRTEDVILARYDGKSIPSTDTNTRLCVFAHYDPQDKLAEYVRFYIKALIDLGLAVIFVSSCQRLALEDVAFLQQFCKHVILKKNIGHDFGSWKVGIDQIPDLTQCRQLVLANDSVFGPLFDLKDMFDVMEAKGYDWWGVVDSYEHTYHLQSFFTVYEKKMLSDRDFKLFWDTYQFYSDKRLVVNKYEIGLTKRFKDKFRVGVYCPYDMLCQNPKTSPSHKRVHWGGDNPMHHYWQELISENHCPFIKRDLLRDNPVESAPLDDWFDFIRDQTQYNPMVIKEYLDRTAMGHRS